MLVNEFGKFQLEAIKLRRIVIFQVTVFEKKDRKKHRLFAETQCSDPYHFLINFYIKYGETLNEIIEKFQKQLLYRGFTPIRFRIRNSEKNKWDNWQHLEHQDPESASEHDTVEKK